MKKYGVKHYIEKNFSEDQIKEYIFSTINNSNCKLTCNNKIKNNKIKNNNLEYINDEIDDIIKIDIDEINEDNIKNLFNEL